MNTKRISNLLFAREAGVSLRTLYRVLSGDLHVSPETRRKVIVSLNRNGCYDRRIQSQRFVVLLSGNNRYWIRRANELEILLKQHPFQIHHFNYISEKNSFLQCVENASNVVICEPIPLELFQQIREVNPDAIIINLSETLGDIFIRGNNHELGFNAGTYLFRNGHRKIAILTQGISDPQEINLNKRAWGCADFFRYYHPEVDFKILDMPVQKRDKKWLRGARCSAYYAVNFWVAKQFLNMAKKYSLAYPEDFSIVTSDMPGKSTITDIPPLDTFFSDLDQQAVFVEYFIAGRMLANDFFPISIYAKTLFSHAGTVKNISGGNSPLESFHSHGNEESATSLYTIN